MKHGERVDVNRDILGLAGANFAAGLSGTFVVNGSPTKTEILDEQGGRSQVANLTMAARRPAGHDVRDGAARGHAQGRPRRASSSSSASASSTCSG